jgi:hypothetical protein
VRVEEIAQLLDTLDPFPFRERDLDKHAEEYIVSWAREFPRSQPIKIIIHAPEDELRSQHANQLGEALGRYFNYRAEAVGRDLNELCRVGRQSLLIGVAVLAACSDRASSHCRTRHRESQRYHEGEPDHPRLGCKLEADRDLLV